MKYNWLLFDADDTLFDFKKSAKYAMTQSLDHFKIDPPEGYYKVYKEINHAAWLAFEKKEITIEELRFSRFDKFLKAIGEYRDPIEMNDFYLHQLSQTDFMIDGAKKMIKELLEAGHELCMITNGLKEVQRPRIAKTKMGQYFKHIIISDEIGVSKPHAGFFEYAFEQIGHPDKSSALVIGDSLSSDIQGGNNFGLSTCWYNPNKNKNLTKHQPTYELHKLQELKKYL